MKQTHPHPSPLKPLIGLHEGKLRVFVASAPISLLSERHWRETKPPKIDSDEISNSLKRLEKYFSQ
jgi:hypothetical protein